MKNVSRLKMGYSCKENWKNMSSTGQGRFCNSCQTEIIDFTAFSHQQIIDYLEKSESSVCEKITSIQLQQKLARRSFRFRNLYKFLASVVLASIIFRVQGQEPFRNNLVEQHSIGSCEPQNHKLTDSITIKGVILDKQTLEPLPFVQITLTESPMNVGCLTDFDGNFELKIAHDKLSDASSLSIQLPGYADEKVYMQKRYIHNSNSIVIGRQNTVYLSPDPVITIGIIITEDSKNKRLIKRKKYREAKKK